MNSEPTLPDAAAPGLPSLRPLRLLSDEPKTRYEPSALRAEGAARIVADVLCGSDGPLVLGIYGPWGHGKTSVLAQTRDRLGALEGKGSLITIWFNAWHYSSYAEPLIPLIAEIATGLEAHRRRLPLLRQRARRNLANIGRALGAVCRSAASFKLSVAGIAELSANSASLQGQPLLDASAYSAAVRSFKDLKKKLATKLVVFVDDLDRCSAEQAVRVLDCMKLVFSEPGILFVVGADPAIIQGQVRTVFRSEVFSPLSYLDKIVQVPFVLPPHRGNVEGYLSTLLADYVRAESSLLVEVCSNELRLIGHCVRENPRSAKRFLNRVLVSLRQVENQGTDAEHARGLLGMCVASHAFKTFLGEQESSFSRLVLDNDLCAALADARSPEGLDKMVQGLKDDGRRAERVHLAESLSGLLSEIQGSELARSWLTEHVRRHAAERLARSEVQDVIVDAEAAETECLRKAASVSLRREVAALTMGDLEGIRSLRLTYQVLTDRGAAIVARMRNLEELYLEATQITDIGLAVIATELRRLRELILRDTHITDAAMAGVGQLPHLAKLDLANTKITDAGLPKLGHVATLEILDLSFMDNISGASLASLSGLTALRKLSLFKTGFSDVNAVGLEGLRWLRELQLGECPRVGDGVIPFLAGWDLIEKLDLSGTELTDAGVQAMPNWSRLMRLALTRTGVSDACIPALSKFRALRHLLIDGTRITPDGMASLAAALPQCAIH